MIKKSILTTLLFAVANFANAQIIVGGKNYTEQQIFAEMTTQYLAAKGFDVEKKAGMGTSILRAAQENGQIDVYWEYTGTSLITFNKIEDKMSADEVYNKVKELDSKVGLTWLNPSDANNTYALAMRRADAEEKGIASISDLSAKINDGMELSFGSNAEFYARPDGFKPLQELYEFELSRDAIKRMDTGLVYQALKDGDVDFGVVFATDGRIPAFDFIVLKDDLGYFPAYFAAPVARTETLEKHPGLEDALNALSAVINDASISALNAQVDVDKVSVEEVSKAFLAENNLL